MTRFKAITFAIFLLFGIVTFGSCRTSTNAGGSKTGAVVNDADGKAVTIADNSRIVSIGIAATETIYALDAGSKLVGIDNSSAEYVPQSAGLPKVGVRTTLDAEGILSLKPTLVILNADSGPPQIFDQLRNAGIAVLTLTPTYTVEAVTQKIDTIGKAVDASDKAAVLDRKIDSEMSDVAKLLAEMPERPKVMFVGKGPNMPNATTSGAGTTIDEMIKLAGGINAFKDFTGFRPMTDEAVVAAQPDAILITEKSFERSGGVNGVVTFPGVALTPAGKNKRIIPVSDMYFQGFGPGISNAVRELALKLHAKANTSELK